MTVSEAAKVTGWSERTIRWLCISGEIGSAREGKRGRHTCIPMPGRIAECLGISVEEIERRLKHGSDSQGQGA